MLKPGSYLGQYEILALLGVGGMGEVYHARDTKVNREVALKLLPEQFARDPERIGRFRREAQVLAQLQHENIALLYNFEETGSARYLVMESVPGETHCGAGPQYRSASDSPGRHSPSLPSHRAYRFCASRLAMGGDDSHQTKPPLAGARGSDKPWRASGLRGEWEISQTIWYNENA
jgi:serine/threonine protein kinase